MSNEMTSQSKIAAILQKALEEKRALLAAGITDRRKINGIWIRARHAMEKAGLSRSEAHAAALPIAVLRS